MTDSPTPEDTVHVRIKLTTWTALRHADARRKKRYMEGQLCLFHPAPPILTAVDVELCEVRPRQS